MLAMAVIGGVRSYSVVPYWDMWEGCIGFLEKLDAGDATAWWQQHNEHRIVWARLFFLADREGFGGDGRFLVAFNYLLAAGSVFAFWKILQRYQDATPADDATKALGFFFVPLLFLWTQEENLTWAFQSQFFLVQLLPLLALYCLHRSVRPGASRSSFALAALLGIASVGTMANGLVILPLMTIYAVVMRQRTLHVVILSLLSVLAVAAYLHGYHSVERHESFTALREHPLTLPKYFLAYLGSPFSFFAPDSMKTWFAYVGGLGLLALTAVSAGSIGATPRKHPLRCALLMFIVFIFTAALITAMGRLRFGPTQALSSRYTTPALMAWAAILVLHSNWLIAALRARRTIVLVAAVVLAAVMLREQTEALRSHAGAIFERDRAALALELGARDSFYIDRIVNPEQPPAIASVQVALSDRRSIFGRPPLAGMREALGTRPGNVGATPGGCGGATSRMQAIPGDAAFMRLEGSMADETRTRELDHAAVVAADGTTVGFVVFRPAGMIVRAGQGTDFGGYVQTAAGQGPLRLQTATTACALSARPDGPAIRP